MTHPSPAGSADPAGAVSAPDSAAQPDAAALQPLLDSRERFLAFLRARIADPQVAEDLLQDSLLKAVRAAPELKDETRLVPWFYRVLQNAVTDAYRRRAAAQTRTTPLEPALSESLPSEPLTAEREAQLCECFRPLVSTLKPEYADVIAALDLAAEPAPDAAARLGITPNNLKVRHHRARQALRKRLEETCRLCAQHHCLDCTCHSTAL